MAKLLTAIGMTIFTSDRRQLRSKGMSADKGMKSASAADIARHWQLEGGIGFLLRLLEARYDVLYQNVTRQSEITPRQFGVLIALYQQGPLTPSVLAERISCDRNTLSEMLKRMAARKLISKKNNADDRRSIQVQITAKGETALLDVIPATAELQNLMLAPLRKEDRSHFLKCLLAMAKAPPSDSPEPSED
jgi:MarR family transcriptional regulator, temperature-dependent positive regulator of motility